MALAGRDGAVRGIDDFRVPPLPSEPVERYEGYFYTLEGQAKRDYLNKRGIKSTRIRWALCVETTAIVIPEWAKLRRFRGFSYAPNRVWFRGRANGMAQILARQDREAGGKPEVTAVEYRRCEVCGRILLNLEAQARRRLAEACRDGRGLRCGGDCG